MAGLERRRSSLQARADTAAAALETAKAARRELLVASDDPPPAKLAAADRAVREAEDARGAAADAGQEIEARIAELGSQLAALIDADQREQRATEVEASAKVADAALLRLRKAVSEISSARQALVEAMGPSCAALYSPPAIDPDRNWMSFLTTTWFAFSSHDTNEMQSLISADETASRIAGHLLGAVLPGCAVTSVEEIAASLKPHGPTQMLMPIDDATEVETLLVGPMRAYAAALRAGSAPLPRHVPAMTISEMARQPRRQMPDAYKVDKDGNAFDLDGNPLDLGDLPDNVKHSVAMAAERAEASQAA